MPWTAIAIGGSLLGGLFGSSKAAKEQKRMRKELQKQREFAMEEKGYSATRHQREVGAGYFDMVSTIVSAGEASTLALKGSTEEEQF